MTKPKAVHLTSSEDKTNTKRYTCQLETCNMPGILFQVPSGILLCTDINHNIESKHIP